MSIMSENIPIPVETPFLPGTASLVEELDKKLLVILRDGRKLVGILRSFDQFANLVLEETVERIIVNDEYADIPRGLYLIRGENVVLLGEVDPEKDAKLEGLTLVTGTEILEAQKKDQEQKAEQAREKRRILMDRGLSLDLGGDDAV